MAARRGGHSKRRWEELPVQDDAAPASKMMMSRGGEGEGCCWRAGQGLELSAPRNGGRVLEGEGRWFGMKRGR